MITLRGTSAKRLSKAATKFGTRHGKKGIEHSPDIVEQRLIQSRPADDPSKDEQLAQWHQAAIPHQDRPAWEQELHETERDQTQRAPRWLLRAGGVALLLVEFTGISGLLAEQGYQNPQRSIVAIGGALLLTYLMKKAATQEDTEKKLWYRAAVITAGVVVIAVTVLRQSEAKSEDVLTRAALATFLTGITLAPSLICIEVVRRIGKVEELARLCRFLRRKITQDVRKCARAAYRIEQRALHCAWWDQMSAMIRAAYTLAFREAGGKVTMQPKVIAASTDARRSLTAISDEFAALEATIRRETRKPTEVPNPYRDQT